MAPLVAFLSLLGLGLVGGEPLRFLVIGDWGTDNNDQYEVAEAMGVFAEQNVVDFIISTGDNFYPNGVDTPDSSRFDSSWKDVYTHPGIADMVWYISVGNHDHDSDLREWHQVTYGDTEPQWYLPDLTFTFTADADNSVVEFFAIDTQSLRHDKNDAEGQLNYLEEQLAASDAEWKIVFGHHPAYSCGNYAGDATLRDDVVPLMLQYDVDFYLAGHDHNLQHWQTASGVDVDYVISGAGGRGLYSYNAGRHAQMEALGMSLLDFSYTHGFTYMVIDDTSAEFTFYNENGEELYSHTRTK